MQSLIVAVDLPTKSRVIEASDQAPYAALALELDLALLRELSAQMDLDERSIDVGDAVAVGPCDDALLDAFGRLFGLVANPKAAKIVAPLITREIHYWLLCVQHGAMLRQLMRENAHGSRIALSIGTIKADYNQPLRVADLARSAGMSVSGFHEHFKAITATTPLQYQNNCALSQRGNYC
jgi:AraC-type transcriptional regulator N-terminus/Bacterial regulatory helix-turn-helix proteins, AraC family